MAGKYSIMANTNLQNWAKNFLPLLNIPCQAQSRLAGAEKRSKEARSDKGVDQKLALAAIFAKRDLDASYNNILRYRTLLVNVLNQDKILPAQSGVILKEFDNIILPTKNNACLKSNLLKVWYQTYIVPLIK